MNFTKYYQGWLRRMRIDGSGGLFLLSGADDKGTLTRFDLSELFPPGAAGRPGGP